MATKNDEVSLIEKLKVGDRETFSLVVKRYYVRLVFVAKKLLLERLFKMHDKRLSHKEKLFNNVQCCKHG